MPKTPKPYSAEHNRAKFTKQRKDVEAKADKGDKKAQAEDIKIRSKVARGAPVGPNATYSAAHNKAKFTKQREDAEAKGMKGDKKAQEMAGTIARKNAGSKTARAK
jgi:lipopolysaccharide export system protein LptC